MGNSRKSTGSSRAAKVNGGNNLTPSNGSKSRTPVQLGLLRIEAHKEINGIGMGVLSDGTPFLTSAGLARLCGINSGRITEIATAWPRSDNNTVAGKIKEILASRGVFLDAPFIEVLEDGGAFRAYPDTLCLAVLEYYAFEASTVSPTAVTNFRFLAHKALADFIYTQVGYDPHKNVPELWKHFQDRVSLVYNAVPRGFFSIFKEMADMIVTLGQSGCHIDDKFVPDISVGSVWGNHWVNGQFDLRFGARIQYEHNYPDYFAQSESNPQQAWCYPNAALSEFRRWIQDDYIATGKFAKYLDSKVKQRQLSASFAQLALAAYGVEGKKVMKKKPGN